MTPNEEVPRLEYDEVSGFIILRRGTQKEVIGRPEGFTIHFWWGWDKRELPVSLDELVAVMTEAEKKKEERKAKSLQ